MDSPYYINYQTLSSKVLKQMLSYEGTAEGDKFRFEVIRRLLSTRRTIRFRVGKTYVEKEL